jgi:hypothetical protein
MFGSFFNPYDPTGGIAGGLADNDGSDSTFSNGEYFNDELEFQDPKQVAMGAFLLNMSQPHNRRDPSAVTRAVMAARTHNTRLRRLMEPKYQVHNGQLIKFGPDGQYQGVTQDFRDPNRNDMTVNGSIMRPNAAGGYDTIHEGPQEPADPFGGTKAMGTDTLLTKNPLTGEIEVAWERPVEEGGTQFDPTKVPEYANTLRDDLRQSTSGYESALETYPTAMQLANTYANPDSTNEDKTQADRGLVNLSVKLFDPTSAVLGGEFDSAAEAQAYFSKLMKRVDPTTGEILDDETRKAMLRLIHNSAQTKIGQLTERYNDFLGPATRLVGADNLDMVIPQRMLENGQIRTNLFDMSPFTQGMEWAGIDWSPELSDAEIEEANRILGR